MNNQRSPIQYSVAGEFDHLTPVAGSGGARGDTARPDISDTVTDTSAGFAHFPLLASGAATSGTPRSEGRRLHNDVEPAHSPIWRTGLHESGHICCSRYLNLEVSGSTLVEGPDYQGLTWGPGSKRALRGKVAYDSDGSAAHDAVAARVAVNVSQFMTGPGEARVDDIFSSVQALTIDLMGGGAAEMAFLGDAPPMFMASDLLNANAIAGIVCSTSASIAAFIEHSYQEALAIIEQNRPVVLALARALIDHPERTLNGAEIDQVIVQALASEAARANRERRAAWKTVENSATLFVASHGLEG